MIVLGIDPGSRITGYGVVQQHGQQIRYMGSGSIRPPLKTYFPERLRTIFDGVCQLIQQFKPQAMAIEQVFMARNVASALKLGHARGAAMVAAVNYQIAVFEYSARQIKQIVTGHGAAEKQQIQHMIRTLLQLNTAPGVDAADALAVAIAHLHSRPVSLRSGVRTTATVESIKQG